ncbi:MAG: hypothetical protein AB3N11_05730, partial [Arenibacterium sp.]
MNIIAMAAGVGATIATLSAISLTLPRHVTVERSAIINAAPDDVLALAASSDGFQSFNPYKTLDPDLKIAPF